MAVLLGQLRATTQQIWGFITPVLSQIAVYTLYNTPAEYRWYYLSIIVDEYNTFKNSDELKWEHAVNQASVNVSVWSALKWMNINMPRGGAWSLKTGLLFHMTTTVGPLIKSFTDNISNSKVYSDTIYRRISVWMNPITATEQRKAVIVFSFVGCDACNKMARYNSV